jgi:hypothetical protein
MKPSLVLLHGSPASGVRRLASDVFRPRQFLSHCSNVVAFSWMRQSQSSLILR